MTLPDWIRWQWLAAILSVALYALWTVTPWGVALEERLGLESLFQLRGERRAPQKVVVLAVTRQSAAELGLSEKLYEWSRSTHAQAVKQLQRLQTRLVVFDVFFENGRDAAGDYAFAEAMQTAGNVLLFARSVRQRIDLGNGIYADQHHLQQPFELFAKAALATAPLILPKIPARVNRFITRHPKLQQQMTLPMLAHQLLAIGGPAVTMPSDNAITHLYNFYGPPRTITTIDYATLFKQSDKVAASVKDAVVFVGFSALEQPDQRDGFYTAFTDAAGLDISGVELAATAFANLQDGSWLRSLPWYVNLVLVIGYGAGCFLAARKLSPVAAIIVIGGIFIVATLLIQYCFSRYYLWLPWCNGVILQTPLMAGLGFWLRSRELQQHKLILQQAFGKYLPADEIDHLIQQRELPAIRELHNSLCLVTDAQGYSRLSESLPPAELSRLMQEYYAAVIEPIRQGGGLISDVAGDGIIALWPHLDRMSVWQSVGPVIESMQIAVEKFNALHRDHSLPTRVGVHAGEIVLGHFGAADHYEFRAMGDLVNTTSRLEGVNKQIGTTILISEDCVVNSAGHMRNIGRFKFVGKDNPFRLFTMVKGDAPDLLRDFDVALATFEKGDWQVAAQQFRDVANHYPLDGPSCFFARYLNEHRQRDQLLPFWQQGIVYLLQK